MGASLKTPSSQTPLSPGCTALYPGAGASKGQSWKLESGEQVRPLLFSPLTFTASEGMFLYVLSQIKVRPAGGVPAKLSLAIFFHVHQDSARRAIFSDASPVGFCKMCSSLMN